MSVRFDASADGLGATTGLPPIASFTMMGWFKVRSARTSSSACFLGFGKSDASGNYYELMVQGASGLVMQLWNGNGTSANGSTLAVDTWVHLALVVSGTGGGGAVSYVNGTLDITTSGFATNTAVKMSVGTSPDGLDWLNGCAVAVKVWDRPLTANEIKQEIPFAYPVNRRGLNRATALQHAGDVFDATTNGRKWTRSGTLTTEGHPPGLTFQPRPQWIGTPSISPLAGFTAGGGGSTNYQVDFSLAVTAALGLTGTAAALGSNAFAGTAALGQSGAAAAAGSVGFPATSGLAQSAGAATGAALSPSATAGLAQAATAAAGAALSQSATAGLTQSGKASAASSLGLSASAAATYGGSAASLGSVSFAATGGLNQSAAAATAASLGLASLSSLGFTTGQAIVVDLAFDVTAGLSLGATAAGSGALGLASTAALGQSATAASLASLTVAVTAGLSLAAGAVANASFNLPAIGAFVADATSAGTGGVVVTSFLLIETALGTLTLEVG